MAIGLSKTGGYFPFDSREDYLENENELLKKKIEMLELENKKIKKHELDSLGLTRLIKIVSDFKTDIAIIIEKQISRDPPIDWSGLNTQKRKVNPKKFYKEKRKWRK